MKLVAVFFLQFLTLIGFSQSTPLYKELYKVSPVSPNAASLGKFGDVPVSLYTGVPNISIPIYNIETGRIKFPISLNYHSGGIKVEEIASWVGLGWALNINGVITKTTMGSDDYEGSFGNGYQSPNAVNIYTLANTPIGGTNECERRTNQVKIADHIVDGEPDIFTISAGGLGGKFFYNQNQQKFITSPLDLYKIEKIPNPSGQLPGLPYGWEITDKQGIVYRFYAKEQALKDVVLQQTNGNIVVPKVFDNAWYLTEIFDPLSNKSIVFEYDTYENSFVAGRLYYDNSRFQPNGSWVVQDYGYYDNIQNLQTRRLKKITFDNGTIDLIGELGYRTDHNDIALDEIVIKNKNGITIKKYSLEYDYFVSDDYPTEWYITNVAYFTHRLKLKKVIDKYLPTYDVLKDKKYSFEYIENIKLPHRWSKAIDHWGFYNGQNSNSTTLPAYPNMTGGQGNGDRGVYADYAKANVLSKIIYPTRGETTFEFENNTDGAGLVGGLRIKKITDYDGISHLNDKLKNYEYVDVNGNSTGRIGFSPVTNNYSRIVVKLNSNGNNNNADELQRRSSSHYPLIYTQSSPVGYNLVTIKNGINAQNGKEEHAFNSFDFAPEMVNQLGSHTSYEYKRGKPVFSNYYKNVGGSLVLSRKDEYQYTTINNGSNYSLGIRSHHTLIAGPLAGRPLVWIGYDPYSPPCPWPVGQGNAIGAIWEQYHVFSDLQYLTSKKVTQYETNIPDIVTNEDYTINNTNLEASEIKTTNSKGQMVTQKTKYVTDYSIFPSNTTPFNVSLIDLINANMITSPVEQIIKKNISGQVGVTEGTYIDYENSKPKEIYHLGITNPITNFQESVNATSGGVKDSRYQSIIKLNAYNNNNLLEQQKTDDIKKSYIWDYNSSYPIAEINGASSFDIAYTSFEADGKGGWSFTGAVSIDPSAPTGKKAYNVNNGNIIKAISSGLTYVVSYWTKNATAFTITGTQAGYPINGRTLNGWKYFEHKITGQTSVTISGNAWIDELRLYPEKTFMTTYTYESLIGMTTQCDVNNRVSYYEYDAFNRLSIIRDQDKNIIKKICYNYAGQVEDCTSPCSNFTPIWQNTTEFRCQQGSCGNNTGYQEQKQIDVNPCNQPPTPPQWVVVGYNPTACPVQTCVNLTSTNTYNTQGYVAVYSNGSGSYPFNVSTASGLQPLGTIPEGIYTLHISRPILGNIYSIFKSGCFRQTFTGNEATFSNIPVSPTGCISITVTREDVGQ